MLREPDKDGRRPMASYEFVALKCIAASISLLTDEHESLKERLQLMVPNGWRDLRMVLSKEKKLLDDICGTIPLNKLEALRSEIDSTRLSICSDGPALTSSNVTHMRSKDLAALLNVCVERECFLCEKDAKKGRKCPIMKGVASVIHYDLGDRPDGLCPLCGISEIAFS